MKYVREHINEVFTQDSDPIDDLQIGMMHQIKKWAESFQISLDKREYKCPEKDKLLLLCVDNKKYKFVEYLLKLGANVHTGGGYHNEDRDLPMRYAIWHNDLRMIKLLLKYDASVYNCLGDDEIQRGRQSYMLNNKSEEVIQIVLDALKQHRLKQKNSSVNEVFTQDSDPVKDMGIGIGEIIKNSEQKIITMSKAFEFEYLFMGTHGRYGTDTGPIRDIMCNPDTRIFRVDFFSNVYRKDKKFINKRKMAKEFLKAAGILGCMERKVDIDRDMKFKDSLYKCTEVIFTIKPEYAKYFVKR